MIYTKAEKDQYNQHRENVCNNLGITRNGYNMFRRLAERLHQIYEDNCNGEYQEERDYFAVVIPLQDKIDSKANKMGLHTYHQTDPRGASLYLSKEMLTPENYNRGSAIY